MVRHYSNVLLSIRLPILLVTNPLHSRHWEAQTVAYYLSDHCLCVRVCVRVVRTHTYALHCSGIQRDPSLPQINFPLFTQLFMWCVAWLEHYSSAGWIQFSSLVELYKSSKTQPSPLSLCETLHLGLFIMTPGKVWACLMTTDRQGVVVITACNNSSWCCAYIHWPVSDLLHMWLLMT